MGGGASLLEISDRVRETAADELVSVIADLYSSDPSRFDAIVAQGKARGLFQLKQIESDIISTDFPASNTSSEIKPFSQEIAKEITILRTQPSMYLEYLRAHLSNFEDVHTFRRKDGVLIKTTEGKSAVEEAIEEISRLNLTSSELGEIVPSLHLEKAAYDHVLDSWKNNVQSHDGSDGSKPRDRIERYCQWSGFIGENIDYGNMDPVDIIVSLYVDDGIPGRGHRKNLLNPEFKMIGSAIGPHNVYGVSCVMNFATLAKDLRDIVSEDCQINLPVQSELTAEFVKAVRSIPGADHQNLLEKAASALREGSEILLDYCYSQSKAVFTFTRTTGSGISTRNMTLSWTAS